MSRKDAHAFAASLAATLMVSIVVFQAGDGTYGAVPADEIDGDEVQVLVLSLLMHWELLNWIRLNTNYYLNVF